MLVRGNQIGASSPGPGIDLRQMMLERAARFDAAVMQALMLRV